MRRDEWGSVANGDEKACHIKVLHIHARVVNSLCDVLSHTCVITEKSGYK